MNVLRHKVNHRDIDGIRNKIEFFGSWRLQKLATKYQIIISVLLVFTGFFLALIYPDSKVNYYALDGVATTIILTSVAYWKYTVGEKHILHDIISSQDNLEALEKQIDG